MTSLLSELVIEPAYRHARRLSRCDSLSSTNSDIDDPRRFYSNPSASSSQSSLHLHDNSIIHFSFWGSNDENLRTAAEPESAPGPEPGILRALTSLISGPSLGRSSGGPFIYPSATSPRSDTVINQASRATSSEDEPRIISVQPRPPPSIVTPVQVDDRVAIDDPTPSFGSIMSMTETETAGQAPQAQAVKQSALPADDGMFLLRDKIREIQQSEKTVEEKARQMLDVMTEEYKKKHRVTRSELARLDDLSERMTSPSAASFDGQRPLTPSSLGSTDLEIRYNLSPADCIPTFVPTKQNPATTPMTPAPSQEGSDMAPSLGCQHYKRNVKLQCSTCLKWYTCRFCHDDVEDHALVRKDTQNMLCMFCWQPQAAGKTCTHCQETAACYYCDICKLWDDDGRKDIYHCKDCGICRKGKGLGKDFFHCKTCAACMSMSIAGAHRCIERSTDCDCPICGDYMFTSPKTVVFMLCGHSIHKNCYYEHMKTSYKCPICSRSIANMESQFRNLDHTIAAQPMPAQFQGTRALISCNDCCVKSVVGYHWLGLKCAECHSYNTSQIQIVRHEDTHSGQPPPLAIDTSMGSNVVDRTMSSRVLSPLEAGAQANTPPPSQPGVEDVPTGAMRRMEQYLAQGAVAEAEARSFHMPMVVPENGNAATVEIEDDEDEDDGESFWGGTDPREVQARQQERERGRSRSPSRVPESPIASHEVAMVEDDEEDDDFDIIGHP